MLLLKDQFIKAENHLMSQNAALVQSNARRDEMAQKLREMEELVKEGFENSFPRMRYKGLL